MSCELKCVSKVVELERIKKLFGLSSENDWLNAVHLCLSPTRDLLVFGHGNLIIGLSPQWDEQRREQHVFKIAWLESLSDENDLVTSLICLPIINATSHSTQSTPEWTCVVAGLSSGYVNFYNDDGHQLRTQRFYEEPVSGLRAQSGRNVEELLTIQYRKCLAIVQGAQLFPLLRTGHKHGSGNSSTVGGQSSLDTKIPCQKWMYDGHCGEIVDSVVIGAQKGCAFDHLLSTCLEDGFNAQYKATRTQTSLVLTTGSRPFLGFQYAKEGFNATELADAAKAVARLIKSALPSWLSSSSGGGNKSQSDQSKSPPPPIMSCQFGICDSQRNSYSVWVAPNKLLAAVSDNLGRVVIVDCQRATIVRMFKGYRDAQCGFIEVKNDAKGAAMKGKSSNSGGGKLRATFLVIYAPRRGILEVWPLQKGQRVGAFSAPKNGQLLYNVHTLMGVPSTSKVKFKGSGCVFFDPQEETFKEIVVPFHLALSGTNSAIAKDMHLLKRLKQIIKGGGGGEDADELQRITTGIGELVPQIQSVDFRRECLDLAATARRTRPEIVMAVVKSMMKEEEGGKEDRIGIVGEEKLRVLCENYSRLVEFYRFIVTEEDNDETVSERGMRKRKTSEPGNKIQLNDLELLNIQKLIDLSTLQTRTRPSGGRGAVKFAQSSSTKVTFDEKGMKTNRFLTFLSVFALDKGSAITLNETKTDEDQIATVGEMIFKSFLELNHPREEEFAVKCKESTIESETLVRLLLAHWLSRPFDYLKFEELIQDLTRFTATLQEICAVANGQLTSDYNAICPWWQNVRELLLENPNSMRSLLAAVMCRNMCLRVGKGKEGGETAEDDCDTEIEDGFENFSQEVCQWNLLIGKLDDISVLGAILNNTMSAEAEVYPKLKHEIPKISLRMILSGGKGVISELVAKWLSGTGIDPHLILEAIETPEEEGESAAGSSSKSNLKDYQLTAGDLMATSGDREKSLKGGSSAELVKLEPILHSLEIMRGNFPFSLQSSKVLCNMGWEYLSHWSKNLAELECLEAGINCLALVREKALRQAMCTMVWRAHLRIPLEAAKKLIFKARKLPNEKLCLQDVGLSDAVVPEFLEKCEKFLKVYLASCTLEMVVIKYEETLKEGPTQPLVELALKGRPAVKEVVEVHLEIVKVLHLLAHFNFKFAKELRLLFDQTGNQLMFGDMSAQPQDAILITEHTRRYRLEFLNRVITAAMELIRWDGEMVFLEDFELWMRRIEKLADEWNVDRVQMNIHTIVEMYAFGWDRAANTTMDEFLKGHAAQKGELGVLLLRIAAFRMHKYPGISGFMKQASYGAQLSDYLDKVCIDHKWPQLQQSPDDISFADLVALCSRSFACLNKSQFTELRVAGELYDACMTLKEAIATTNAAA